MSAVDLSVETSTAEAGHVLPELGYDGRVSLDGHQASDGTSNVPVLLAVW